MTDSDALEPYGVRAVNRTLDILELLDEPSRPVSLGDVVAKTGLPKTSAFRYLATLERRGYVTRTASGSYLPTRSFGHPWESDLDELARRAQPMLEQLRDQFTETVSLGALDLHRAFYVSVVRPLRSVRVDINSGARAMIHCTAFGKALAARIPEERVREILDMQGMPRFTSRTITDPDRYLQELARVRRAGYAVNNGENEVGARCVALALTSTVIPLAVSLSAPADRMPMQRIQQVVAAFHEFDDAFGARGGTP
ncbi:IclR family transcriptional regulator [Phytoactinopolyspora halotolerans]|uniref:IclR family transcriptional regulator n=1 Tax=Phytoactinopolyspora halotolerans TaxID=1981512 RepID=A0A6L9SGN1_9ACTN|nr:IclR family transcriptional regulator [Phytoactinopolyspora halotolerans]NEE03260.1 IclR family transcriptional regulator [Phytoactinopolyspora halotolerans]